MKNLKFKFAAAYNFLPFGPEGIELHFDNYKNIVLVRGENRDAKKIESSQLSDELKVSSNGTGKSSIQEIISYGLFGKTVKRPEKLGANDVVHNKVGKDARVELIFDNIKIIRTRKEGGKDTKNSLRLWESSEGVWDKTTEITQGTMALTQKKIEELIGLSYEAFINMSVFTDDQRACFLECESKQKKEIVENMLSLGVYREWFENAKNLRKEIKGKVEIKAKEYALLVNSRDEAERRLNLTKQKEDKWKKDKQSELDKLKTDFSTFTSLLGKTDNGVAILAYQQAQEKIKELNEKIPSQEKDKSENQNKLELARQKETEIKKEAQTVSDEYQEIAKKSKTLLQEKQAKENEIKNMKTNVPGTKCDKCKGDILQENINDYIAKLELDIVEINAVLKVFVENAKEIQKRAETTKEKQEKIKKIIDGLIANINTIDNELTKTRNELVKASQVREPKTGNEEALLQQKIEALTKQMEEKSQELLADTPFKEILQNDEDELRSSKQKVIEKEKEVKELEKEIPYYDYWITGFGDNGIRKWIVDGIIPELNNRINYWLQFLIDNRITLKFDNELNEKIERNPVDGSPYIYHAMSTGQRRRLNLAVSQSFAHIMMLSSGSIPSIVFLDEVTTNVDPLGVQGIYNMICELAEDRQVFVTTHDPDLIRMLQTADTIQLVHENGFTKLVV
jgi:DNA repair exonuclease SbcCD ATPase subunit